MVLMKLGVGYPWMSPFMFTDFVDATLNMKHPEGYDVRFFRGVGWCPARRHVSLCEQALEWGADIICIIGSDQIHPEDMLCKLIKRMDEGYDAVAAFVPVRGYLNWQEMKPFMPMGWRFKTNDEFGDIKYREYHNMEETGDYLHIVTKQDGNNKEHPDMAQVDFIGSGVLMFYTEHLMSLERPWFFETIDRESQIRIANMDCTFAWRLQMEAGAKIWVDTTIMVQHLHVFPVDDTYSERFADWKKPGVGDSHICVFKSKDGKKQIQADI